MEVCNDFRVLTCLGVIRQNDTGGKYLIDFNSSDFDVTTSDKNVAYKMRTLSNKVVNLLADDTKGAMLLNEIEVTNLKVDENGEIVRGNGTKTINTLDDLMERLDKFLYNRIDYKVIQLNNNITKDDMNVIKNFIDNYNKQSNRQVYYKIVNNAILLK